MSIDLSILKNATRLLFEIPLRPVQGQRFQPTGFPSLGAATFQTQEGLCLLVESAQSMANRFEDVCWDYAQQKPVPALDGISHVTILRKKEFFTDTMLEAHRINSPYLLEAKNKSFFNDLKNDLGELEEGPINRRKLADALLKYDANSLIHGVFLAKKDLAGGRLRITRALTGFIEAKGVRVAASGGVKNDHVNPQGNTKAGFGNVPFARDEYTAEQIILYTSVDLSLLRGYGLTPEAEHMLILLALYKIAALVEGGLRLRTACDLVMANEGPINANKPQDFVLPSSTELAIALQEIIPKVNVMTHKEYDYDDELKKAKNDSNED